MIHYTRWYGIKVPLKCINLKNTKEIQLNDNNERSLCKDEKKIFFQREISIKLLKGDNY